MHTTGAQLVAAYSKGNPKERFTLIYRNYCVFLQVVNSYETGVYNRILCEKQYNRRQKGASLEELGVRIQNYRKSDRTANEAIEHVVIQQAIEDCDFAGELLKDTDEPEKHMRDILTISVMRQEFEVFASSLGALPPKEKRITCRYLSKEISATKLAEDEDIADQTLRNILSMTRKTMQEGSMPFFRESIA